MAGQSQVLSERLLSMARNYEIELTDEQAHLLVKHLLLVMEKNKQLNLTSITDVNDGLVLHVMDSLLFLPYMFDCSSFVDIGTGGGFPGIPLSICLPSTATLIDSVGKKVAAVNSFIEELALDQRCTAVSVRVEEFAVSHSEAFDAVVARAVAPCNVLLEYASPLLLHKGRLVLSKAPLSPEEEAEGLRAADLVGMSLVSRETFELPSDMGKREILVFEKTHEPSVKLPRRVGVAKKRPLGTR